MDAVFRGGLKRFRAKRIALVILVGVILAVATYYVPTGYVLVVPGPTRNLSESVRVEGGSMKHGHLLMTTVTSRGANPVLYLYGLVNPRADLTPQRFLVSPGRDQKEYWEYQKRLMEESQAAAKVAALRHMGYQAHLLGTGVRVVGFLPGTTARGLLQEGDIVLGVDGIPVYLASELVYEMTQITPGDAVSLRVKRAERELEIVVPTILLPEEKRAIVGILVETAGYAADIPLDIEIDVNDVSGPSAGLMFSLEILNQMSHSDLTHGFTVAGTGTIRGDGTVGPVGGVKQKVYAAESSGADVFLVPCDNATDALEVATNLRVLPISSLEDAIERLSGLEESG